MDAHPGSAEAHGGPGRADAEPADTALTLRVNGREVPVSADPATPLLYVLRDELGLTGTKYGCGLEQCHACAVLVDGEEVTSCTTPVDRVAGREITTIEGLADGTTLHPVQQAFLDEEAAQCGYCIPGMIVGGVALLGTHPNPTDAEIAAALHPHLCRCGSHSRILAAIRRAAGDAGATGHGTLPGRPTGARRGR